ncbi:response regulator [Zavarzinia compransoris]|uniref:response regulator transcription factor n=1 Tax=Zavarzinia marina TaxID=2911065 RepID=UPI001F26F71C|nr:response regulator [Zavarzinia marina]MCF4165875.1 response regulator [Zavarzinia marina]
MDTSPVTYGAAATRPRIVVIEDDAALLDALSFALDTEGYETRGFLGEADVLEAGGLADADCFVIDYLLSPMDGLEVLAELRRLGATAPAILITTKPDHHCRRRARLMGAAIVEKPLMTDALSRKIRSLL